MPYKELACLRKMLQESEREKEKVKRRNLQLEREKEKVKRRNLQLVAAMAARGVDEPQDVDLLEETARYT